MPRRTGDSRVGGRLLLAVIASLTLHVGAGAWIALRHGRTTPAAPVSAVWSLVPESNLGPPVEAPAPAPAAGVVEAPPAPIVQALPPPSPPPKAEPAAPVQEAAPPPVITPEVHESIPAGAPWSRAPREAAARALGEALQRGADAAGWTARASSDLLQRIGRASVPTRAGGSGAAAPQPPAERAGAGGPDPAPPVPGGGPVTPPKALAGNRTPEYPRGSRESRTQGTVLVRLELRADGSVGGASVARTSGAVELDAAAVEACRAWRFEPAMAEGRTVACVVTLPVEFKSR